MESNRVCKKCGDISVWDSYFQSWICTQCGDMIRKPITNADYVRQMTDDKLAEWYWWMLHYVQGYTDSQVALHEWLKQDYITFVAQEYEKDLNDRLNREGIAP